MPPSLLSLLTLTLAQYGDASVTMPVLPGGTLLFIRQCSTVCAFTKDCASEALIVSQLRWFCTHSVCRNLPVSAYMGVSD